MECVWCSLTICTTVLTSIKLRPSAESVFLVSLSKLLIFVYQVTPPAGRSTQQGTFHHWLAVTIFQLLAVKCNFGSEPFIFSRMLSNVNKQLKKEASEVHLVLQHDTSFFLPSVPFFPLSAAGWIVCESTSKILTACCLSALSILQPLSGPKMPLATTSWLRSGNMCLRWCQNMSSRFRCVHPISHMLVFFLNLILNLYSLLLQPNKLDTRRHFCIMCVCVLMCTGNLLQWAGGDDPPWRCDSCPDLPEGPHQRSVQKHDRSDSSRHPNKTEPLWGARAHTLRNCTVTLTHMHREGLVLSLKGYNVGRGKFISEARQQLDEFYFIAVK